MALTQETFLGASIRNFRSTLGWGEQTSTLEVGVVEDPSNGDNFDPPAVGSAVIFNYQGWQFGGLLQSWTQESGQQGNPIFNVKLEDPRELLAGVQLILQDYTGSTYGVSNLYNIYGYLETLYGFGGSQANADGIPWKLVRDAFYRLQLTTPIYFRGSYFLFDPLIDFDLLPDYYRVGGDSISAMGFIIDICRAASCDFYIDMIPFEADETPIANAIKVRLIARNSTVRTGSINEFVSATEGAVSKQSGYELGNEVMSKFLVGGKLNNLYFQAQAYTENNVDDEEYKENPSWYYDDVIAPYWGYLADGMLSVGWGDFYGENGSEYQFYINGIPLYLQTNKPIFTPNYLTDLAEMRAAREGQDAWEAFLWFHSNIEDSIHKWKSAALNLIDNQFNPTLFDALKAARDGADLPDPVPVLNTKTTSADEENWKQDQIRKQIEAVYSYIKIFANEYYGKKFMVRIPFVAGAFIPETNYEIRLSLTPTQTGYVEESLWGQAQYYGYMPFNPEKFTDNNNKLYCYAGFANISGTTNGALKSKYGLEKLSPQSYILDQYPNQKAGRIRENMYVKCSVEEKLVFLNPYTLFSPRVVVTLDAPLSDAVDKTKLKYGGLIEEMTYYLKSGGIDDDEADEWGRKFGDKFGNDMLWYSKEANFYMPDMVAVPLENNILRYGPWYISNGAGKVDFENDSSLVPWNFGGYTVMNYAGWAKVSEALTSQQVFETGSVEFPGAPGRTMGQALVAGGPVITDVNVSVAEDGVKTSYRMATWIPEFGTMRKYNVDRLKNMSLIAQQQRKNFRILFGYPKPLNIFVGQEQSKKQDVEKTHHFMCGDMAVEGEGDDKTVKPSIVTSTVGKMKKSLSNDSYSNKGGISLDGLYVPYTTNVDHTGNLPHFESPGDGATTPTVTELNPFGSFGGVVLRDGDTVPGDLTDDGGDLKAVAFRAPMIVGGWGYDTDGNFVPSGEPNYKNRADKWKVGPIDLRWSEDRKVWVTGSSGGTEVKIGKTKTALYSDGSVDVDIWGWDSNGDPYDTGEDQNDVRDWLLAEDEYLGYNARVIMIKIGDEWVIVSARQEC
jgi:hypothetical protein